MKESLLTEIFLHAGLFFVLASLIIPFLRFLKIPTALGYLLAGIIVGPYGIGALADTIPILGIISLENTDHIKILSELSIIFLLFVIGLELTPSRLWQLRNLVFGLGSAQVVISALVIGSIAYLWGNSVQISILLGLSLALSSTAIVLQWLQEKKLFASPVGKSSFSILLLQDLAVIPILFLLTVFTANFDGAVHNFIFISVLKMAAAVIAIYVGGRIFLKPVFYFANKHGGPEVFVALALLTIVASASIAHYAGLSMALGAFIAGLLLAETEYKYEVSFFVVPFKSMLLGIFFFSFGMGINLEFIAETPLWLFLSVIGLMSIKAVIIFILCRLWRQSTAISAEAAILLSQSGEFGLLVVGSALSASLMPESVGQFMLITIGLTMLVTPIIAPLSHKVGEFFDSRETHKNKSIPALEDNDHPDIILFGYGRVGRHIANTLCKEGFSIVGFDNKVEKVNRAKKEFYPVYLGDARKKNTLNATCFENATCIVITIDNEKATQQIVKLVREKNSDIPIIVRTQESENIETLHEFGNVDAIGEDVLISEELSKIALTYTRID